jgi:hypothetical protein
MYSYPLKIQIVQSESILTVKDILAIGVLDSENKVVLFLVNINTNNKGLDNIEVFTDIEKNNLLCKIKKDKGKHQIVKADNTQLGTVSGGGGLVTIPTHHIYNASDEEIGTVQKETGLFSYWKKDYFVNYNKNRVGHMSFEGSFKNDVKVFRLEKIGEFSDNDELLLVIGTILTSCWELLSKS